MRKDNQMLHSYGFTMNALKDIIQRCHQRHNKPLRQRKTIVTPALDKGSLYHFTVLCAYKYPVRLYELEQAGISFMPIGHTPHYDHGPKNCGGERFLRQQRLKDWETRLWERSWGIQVYTGTPSESNGAQWHDIDFNYDAICAAPDAIFDCIEALINAVVNPLLTITKSGGLRFSCRVQDYLHPNSATAKQYIYKHTPTPENPEHRDVYLEILGEAGYSRWDARYEILLGNLLDPPIIAKEVLFAAIDRLRTTLHEPIPSGDKELAVTTQAAPVAPVSLGSHNLDLAKEALLKRGFSYVQEENSVYHWTRPSGKGSDEHVSLWEQAGTVWIHASTSDTGLPTSPTPITDIWDNTGILPAIPATGLPLTDKVLAVREGKLSPLAIKRPNPILQKPERENKVYQTLEENAAQMQRVFNRNARILGLIAETGAGKSYAAESYLLNGGAISFSARHSLANEIEQRFAKRNVPSFARWKPRMHLWGQVKDIPVEVRMATPFQRGNVCEDPERCDALEKKGGNPSESICPQCPVYIQCQQRGYLSQSATLKGAKAQILSPILGTEEKFLHPQYSEKFLHPQYSETASEMLEQVDDTERLCIIDELPVYSLFILSHLHKKILEGWRVNWQGSALGNFSNALLNALETKNGPDGNAVGRIRTAVQAFEGQEEMLVQQMCQVNIPGKVVLQGIVDAETGTALARFTIEFEGGASAYIPLGDNATDRLIAQQLPFFSLGDVVLNEDIKISMSMAEAIALGILDTSTVENIKAFPTVYRNPNWTFWHQLKHFFAHYTRDADAPMLWTNNKSIHFWMPPVLHPSVKRLMFMSPQTSEQDLRKVFPDEEIEVTHINPTAWVAGNQVFQIRTGIYPRQAILNYDTDWDRLGMSKIGQRFFLGIQAEIEKDPNVKHAIITSAPVMQHLQNIAAKENVRFVRGFKEIGELDTTFETAEVIWIVGTPYWEPALFWRQAQILFGNEEKSLCYEGETESGDYKDERVRRMYEQSTGGLLADIVGRTGLNRLPNKTVVLLTGLPLPDITDRPETLLFDWEDFEVAGGLDKLPEVIATRERFETERDNLAPESGRKKVEQVLGVSKSQANRVLMKLRGGKLQRVPFHEQIFSLLEGGEKKTAELIEAIEGHPGSIKNELKRLVDTGKIVKVRRSVYALPSA